MNKRERFLCVIDKRQPDRVALFATLTPQVAETLGRQMRLPIEAVRKFGHYT